MTGAPVVPVGLWGTEHVWPRSARVPNVLNVTSPPTVITRVGPQVALTGDDDPAVDTDRIMDALMSLLPAESRERREPTEDEIRKASPPA